MTIHADLNDGIITVRAPARLAGLFGAMPGFRYSQADDRWTAPDHFANFLALAKDVSGLEGWAPTPALTARLRHHKEDADSAEMAKGEGADVPVYDDRLYPYQNLGVALLVGSPGFLLGDEMGTGKTVMALAAARSLQAKATLVVAPNSMKHRWAREAETWYPRAAAFVVHGTKAQRDRTFAEIHTAIDHGLPVVVAVNWESLRTLSRVAGWGSIKRTEADAAEGPLNHIDWDVVIADEAHRAKDPHSKQTRALWYVARHARHRWALTGTPMLNTPTDLWAVGRFFDPDGYGASRQKWHDRFVSFIETRYGPKDLGLNRLREREFLMSFDRTFLRRTKDEVLDLPPITYQQRIIPLSAKQRSAYNRMVEELIAAIDGGILVATDELSLLTRLTQIASATPVIDEAGNVVALDRPSNKLDALLEIIDEAGGKQLAVFAASRKLIELAAHEVERKGITTVQITGAVDPALRDQGIEAFQAGERQVALCTLGAGSEGINLYAASTAVFLQRSYNYGQSQQAEARIHRNGQTADKVTIIDVVSEDTVDEAVLEALAGKNEMAEEILRDTARSIIRKV